MSDEIERLQRRLERERKARKEAEYLLEKKSLELYNANLSLQASAANLEREVARRTDALSAALAEAENANLKLNETRRALEQQLFAIDQHTIVSIADVAGNITYANQRFVEISGYSQEELLGTNHRIVNSGTHPRAVFDEMWQTISGGKVWSGELCNRSKSGSLYWVSATIVPFLDEQGLPLHYMSIRSDITPLKQAEAALRNTVSELNERVKEWRSARDAAEAANRAKSDFLANMSHEIRTPMNGIIGMTELALDASSEHERRECMETVRRSAESLLGIINDILDFSKIEAGKLVVEQVGFDLTRTVNECLHPLRVQATEKQLAFRCEIDDSVPAHVQGDPTRLRQILVNLAGNAIKFTEQGEVTVRIEKAADPDLGSHLRFSVTDSGIGIPADKLDTIFESFSQADTSTTRKYGGSGLGLTITKRLVDLMGGSLAVESRHGVGSTFYFNLPLKAVDSPAVAASEARPELTMPPMRLLLVEDNKVNQKLALRLLEKWGHKTELAENGFEALQRLSGGERFDMVLMDMQMPVMGGIEATQRIRAMEAERGFVPHVIVAMTANAMQGDREACLDAGMDDYLSKPIRQVALAAVLARYAPFGPDGGSAADGG